MPSCGAGADGGGGRRTDHAVADMITVTVNSSGCPFAGTIPLGAVAGYRGASDAYLSSGDLVKAPSLLNIPLAVSAQLVIYNLPGLGQGSHVELNGQVLAGMYDGTITRWDDPAIANLNPHLNLPDIKVVPVHRSDSSGDTFLFTSYLSTQDPAWNNDHGYGTTVAWPPVSAAIAASGSSTLLADCARTPGCVAYNGISYLTQTLADRLGYAALANTVGPLLSAAAGNAQAAPYLAAAQRDAPAWYAANEQVYKLGASAQYQAERDMVIGTGPGSSAAGYDQLERDISQALAASQQTFRSGANSGASAFGPLEGVVIAASLLIAASSAWGLSRRIAEYR